MEEKYINKPNLLTDDEGFTWFFDSSTGQYSREFYKKKIIKNGYYIHFRIYFGISVRPIHKETPNAFKAYYNFEYIALAINRDADVLPEDDDYYRISAQSI
jgi:hypothetical protein